jgi:hypothetical protein
LRETAIRDGREVAFVQAARGAEAMSETAQVDLLRAECATLRAEVKFFEHRFQSCPFCGDQGCECMAGEERRGRERVEAALRELVLSADLFCTVSNQDRWKNDEWWRWAVSGLSKALIQARAVLRDTAPVEEPKP